MLSEDQFFRAWFKQNKKEIEVKFWVHSVSMKKVKHLDFFDFAKQLYKKNFNSNNN